MAYTDIDKPTDYFNTVLYTANNGTLNVTGVGFQPDWVWIKGRSYTVHSNMYDVVRGVQKDLLSGSTNAETSSGELTSFDSDGFTVVDSATDRANYLTNTHVAWNWLASNTTASNTDGSITSTVSVNTTSGFSIVTYTGTSSAETIGHGLGSAPKVVIVKRRSSGGTQNDWSVFHSSLPVTNILILNTTGAAYNPSFNDFQDTAPTSDVFYITATAGRTNANGIDYVAYCFAEKKGFSKFGSYTGNGNADGTFVYTGFKPAFVIVKQTNIARTWVTLDNKRANSYNPQGSALFPNTSEAETTGYDCDFLSNGFKIRNSGNSLNNSGGTFIFMAFAESPFTTSTGIPTTAR